MEEDAKIIDCEIKVKQLAEKLNYPKGMAQALHNIGNVYYRLGQWKESLQYYLESLNIREKIGDKKDISSSYNNIGNTFDHMGDKKSAVEYHLKSLLLKEELKDTLGMARSLSNIASAYLDIPDYYQAVEYGFRAEKLYEAKGENTGNYAEALNNIGLAYERMKDFEKALTYYRKSLVIQEKLEDKQEIARLIDNIAIIYHLQGQLSKKLTEKNEKFRSAIDYYYKALDLLAGSDINELTALIYNNIGNTYWELYDFPNAFNVLNKSLDAYQKLDNKRGTASALNSLATHFKLQKNYIQSIRYSLQALTIADSIQDIEQIKNACEILSYGYRETKQFEKSLFYYTRYAEEKEKMINVEGAKELAQKESKMEFDKQKEKMNAEQKEERIKAEEKSRRQQLITWSVGGGLLLVVVFSIFILNRWRITQKQKKIIEVQKVEVERQRELADSRRIIAEEQKQVIEIQKVEVEKQKEIADEQKKLVEEKNKDITDSINYAKRIQRAMLPHRSDIWKAFPQSFVLFKPKDIVSGDFYFFLKNKHSAFIAAADCTGHGVPGAFMSLIGSEKLYDAVAESSDTSEILSLLNKGVKTSLKQSDSDDSTRDGMDIAFCSVDTDNRVVKYAGANRPIWIIRKGATEVEEIKATKKAIGGLTEDEQHYEIHEIRLQEGDSFYLSTDGYGDTFGVNGKKLMTKRFKDTLLSIQEKSMKEQEKHLDEFVENWMAGVEQVDDILVIGIKL